MEPVKDMTNDELNTLAQDFVANQVFTDQDLKESLHLLPQIFMPLIFVGKDEIPDNIGLIYEYMSEANPMALNGFPTFFSMRLLSRHDLPILIEKITKIEDTIKEALK